MSLPKHYCKMCGARTLQEHIKKIQKGFYAHVYKRAEVKGK